MRAAWRDHLDVAPAALAWREAYALLLLAPGPFRVLHPDWKTRMAVRLDLAERLLGTDRLSPSP
ncbi:MAG: hypothetical protein ACRDY7_16265 [Acidimicrobiia bacterium]